MMLITLSLALLALASAMPAADEATCNCGCDGEPKDVMVADCESCTLDACKAACGAGVTSVSQSGCADNSDDNDIVCPGVPAEELLGKLFGIIACTVESESECQSFAQGDEKADMAVACKCFGAMADCASKADCQLSKAKIDECNKECGEGTCSGSPTMVLSAVALLAAAGVRAL